MPLLVLPLPLPLVVKVDRRCNDLRTFALYVLVRVLLRRGDVPVCTVEAAVAPAAAAAGSGSGTPRGKGKQEDIGSSDSSLSIDVALPALPLPTRTSEVVKPRQLSVSRKTLLSPVAHCSSELLALSQPLSDLLSRLHRTARPCRTQ